MVGVIVLSGFDPCHYIQGLDDFNEGATKLEEETALALAIVSDGRLKWC